MIRTGWLAALALALAPLPCLGQPGGMGGMGSRMGGGMGPGGVPRDAEEWTVRIETGGGQSVTGRLKLATVAVQCDLGLYEIRPEKIKEIQFIAIAKETPYIFGMMGGQREGTLMTASGEQIAGTVAIPPWWRVRTDLGILTPDGQKIKSITFVARVAAPVDPKPEGPTPAPANPARASPAADPPG